MGDIARHTSGAEFVGSAPTSDGYWMSYWAFADGRVGLSMALQPGVRGPVRRVTVCRDYEHAVEVARRKLDARWTFYLADHARRPSFPETRLRILLMEMPSPPRRIFEDYSADGPVHPATALAAIRGAFTG